MTNTNSIKRMSDMVISCELRAAWGEVECNMRHGAEVSKRTADYIAALTDEQKRRAA
jgi:hypothetical protein